MRAKNYGVVDGGSKTNDAVIEHSNGGSETPVVEQGTSDSGQIPQDDHASDGGRNVEATPSQEVPLVIKVDGVIAQICDLHGPYIGTCIDCM